MKLKVFCGWIEKLSLTKKPVHKNARLNLTKLYLKYCHSKSRVCFVFTNIIYSKKFCLIRIELMWLNTITVNSIVLVCKLHLIFKISVFYFYVISFLHSVACTSRNKSDGTLCVVHSICFLWIESSRLDLTKYSGLYFWWNCSFYCR